MDPHLFAEPASAGFSKDTQAVGGLSEAGLKPADVEYLR
jgi:hypothetical protein